MSGTDNVAVAKLARILRVPVEELSFLADVPAADLIEFRRQVGDMLFEYQSRRLAGIAAAARVLPAPVIAKLVQLKPNALLTAGAAGVLEPAQAVDVAKRLPPAFLADVAALLDPRRCERIVAKLPDKTIVAVAREIARREDWMTLGELVGIITDQAAAATIAVLDPAAILEGAMMVDAPDSLSRFARLLSEAKLTDVLAVIAETDRWDDARPLLHAFSEPGVERALAAAERLPADHRERALAEITAHANR